MRKRTKKQLTRESLALKVIIFVMGICIVGSGVKAVPVGFWDDVKEKVANGLVEEVMSKMFGEEEEELGSSGSRFPNGISADSTSPSAGEVRGTTLTTTGVGTIGGAATLSSTLTVSGESQMSTVISGGSVYSSSTTATAGTLTAAQICDNSVILFTPNATGGLALTLPATSTLFADCLDTDGDFKTVLLKNVTSTAETDIIITAGTGNVLVGSPTTTAATEDNTEEDSYVRMVFTRLGDAVGNVLVELVNFNDTD